MRRILTVLILLLLSVRAFSQALSIPSDGKDFWIGYMYPSYNKVANPTIEGFYSSYLLISTYTQVTVQVTYFDRATGVESQTGQYKIPERTGIQVPISLENVKMMDSGDVPEWAAIHVTANRAVHVEFFSTGVCSGGSFMPIQTPLLGTKYVIASYNNNPGSGGFIDTSASALFNPRYLEVSEGFFEIIAPFDYTQVTITPNSTTMGGYPGFHSGAHHTFPNKQPYTVNLFRGQCYLVKSASDDSNDDISGSLVESNKPIAVIAGHENAMLGGVSGKPREGRDFMVEQMYPVSTWDTGGYVMIPLRDSQPADPNQFEGVGENYRTYAFDDGTGIDMFNSCVSGPTNMTTFQLAQPAPEQINITCPVDFEGTAGKKFSVMMYDLRNVANTPIFPAPSMITVIPMSRWKTSYLWYVPANKFEIQQGYYADVIGPTPDFDGPNGILASFNGGPIRPIKTVLSVVQSWKGIIPNNPILTGVQFKLNPGSYYVHGPHPFIVYNFGFRGIDPDNSLGDSDRDDFFFSYGTPTGMSMRSPPHMRISVDTLCSSWDVCVHDSTSGIRSVTLMDDPTGDQFDVHPGKQYYNTRLDDSLDATHSNEIILTNSVSDFCFKVNVNNGTDSGYAPIVITDNAGAAEMFELRYARPKVRLIPNSGKYLFAELNKDTCLRYVFTNTASPGNDFHLTSATLAHNTPGFKISSTVPGLPSTIHSGDSLVVTACYTPVDTNTRIDTLILKTDCFTAPISLTGSGGIPIILASNHDFGGVDIDSTKCDTVGVYNIGKYPFILNSQWVISNFGSRLKFQLDPTDSILLANPGIILSPGQKRLFHFCYTPTEETSDSATQHWGTTLEPPYQHSSKDFSLLYGHGIKLGFIWNKPGILFELDTMGITKSQTTRVFLLSNSAAGSPKSHIDSVFINGTNGNEFKIVANQLGLTSLANFDLNAGDSIWVDIEFIPDETKPYPDRFADRSAELVARGPGEKDKIMNLYGIFAGASGVKNISRASFFSIYPNPSSGNSIIISFSNGQDAIYGVSTVVINDILGREVYRKDIEINNNYLVIPIANLPEGSYYARIFGGNFHGEEKFEIRR